MSNIIITKEPLSNPTAHNADGSVICTAPYGGRVTTYHCLNPLCRVYVRIVLYENKHCCINIAFDEETVKIYELPDTEESADVIIEFIMPKNTECLSCGHIFRR